MSALYPRLLPDAASEAWADLQKDGPAPPGAQAPPSLARAVFAATGGRRVTGEQLAAVRSDLVRLAHEAGMPNQADLQARTAFDISGARYLHEKLDLAPGEASQRPIWTYFGLILVPDVCAWRYPPRQPRGYFEERFRCVDVTRHTLARLWLRAFLLHDPDAADPYELLPVLGENDMDQILSRREDVAASPSLVRAVVRSHRDDPSESAGEARMMLRDSTKRLLRLAAFTNFEALTPEELHELVAEQRGFSRQAFRRAASEPART